MNGTWPRLEGILDWWYPVVGWGAVLAALAAATMPKGMAESRWGRWLVVACGAVSLVPIDGLPLGRWLHGIDGNLSIPLVALMIDRVTEAWRGRPLLDARARKTAGWFGVACGLALYPLAMGLGGYDPYVLGWQSPGIMAVAAVLGAVLLLRGDGFGLVLLVAGMLWQLDVLESENGWDYLVDPVYFILSVISLVGTTFFVKRSASTIEARSAS